MVGVVFGFGYGDIHNMAKGHGSSSGGYITVICTCVSITVIRWFDCRQLAMGRHIGGIMVVRNRTWEVAGHGRAF